MLMVFDEDRRILAELLTDVEKQIQDFNFNVPFKYNQDVYSPRLVNMLLTICTQIEAFCDLYITEFSLSGPSGDGMKDVLRQLDQNSVLRNMVWTSILGTSHSPFSSSYEWWTKYNKIKHELINEIHSVKYHHVIDSAVALQSLHRLAVARIEFNMTNQELLDSANWEIDGFQRYSSNLNLFMTATTPLRRFQNQ